MHFAWVEATVAGDALPIDGPLRRWREVVHGGKRLPGLGQHQELVEVYVRVPAAAYFELLVGEKDAAAVRMLRRQFVRVEVFQHLVAEQKNLANVPGHVAHAEFAAGASAEGDAFDFDEVRGAAVHKSHIPAAAGLSQACRWRASTQSIVKCDRVQIQNSL